MASNHCPACTSKAVPDLIAGIKGSHVDYYHCPECHHVWTATKDGQTVVSHLTPLPERAPLPAR